MTTSHALGTFALPNIVLLVITLFNGVFKWWEELTPKMAMGIYAGIMGAIAAAWALPALLPQEPQMPTFSLVVPLGLAAVNGAGSWYAHYLERRRSE